MKSKSAKKFLSGLSAAAIMATLLVGAFSYFTDYQTKQLTAKAGTLTMTMTDTTTDLTSGEQILNPGDSNELTFTANNTGEKSMDVKAVITISTENEMSKDSPQYKLTNNGTEMSGSLSDDKKTLTYSIDDVILNGSIEKEDSISETSHVYSYLFEMDESADNTWQNSNVTVNVELFAKQHRNTSALGSDWTSIVETP